MEQPRDVATQATLEYVSAFAPTSATILEIGCGNGDVAAALKARGFALTGIDADAAAVEATAAKGVPTIAGEWPDVFTPPVDVVLFTRSLHHIRDLSEGLNAAQKVLRGPRLLLVEDFDFTSPDPATIRWLVARVREAAAKSLLQNNQDEFAARMTSASNPMTAWHENHDHDLHSADKIAVAVAEGFSIVRTEDVPYLYRYLIPVLEDTARATEWLAAILQEERSLGEAGEIKLIGRRIVAKAK